MKYFIITLTTLFYFNSAISCNLSGEKDGIIEVFGNAKYKSGIFKSPTNFESCLQTALAGINQAYAVYDDMVRWCASVQSTGQGFLDCSRYFRAIREYQVAMVYYNFEHCSDYISL